MSDNKTTCLPAEAPEPWWNGTIIPTGRYRLKKDPWDRLHLQHLVTSPVSGRRRWIYIKTVAHGALDDE